MIYAPFIDTIRNVFFISKHFCSCWFHLFHSGRVMHDTGTNRLIACVFHDMNYERIYHYLLLLCSLMMCANNRVHHGPIVVFVCFHITLPQYHHYADLSESIDFLKCFLRIFCLECVFKIKSTLSIFVHAIYGAVRTHLTHFSYDDCENGCTFILLSASNRKYDPIALV